MSYSTTEATDKINVQQVVPSSGQSACPGADVIINCTVIRTDDTVQATPTVTWKFLNIYGIRSDGSRTANFPPKDLM